MNVLLDTCALLALARGDLPNAAAASLRAAPEVWVSSVSAWEVAIKVAHGKLQLRQPPIQWFMGLVARYSLRELSLDAKTACAAALLPSIHRDPFDRALVALACAEALPIVTSDRTIATYPGVRVIW